ncbi:hypothetical protein AKO1_007318 [Acrasis kona]|uniref:Structural maintenance of chromosomes protein 5 n=1 Tax=Acrasis kona TaxID=1008807 RepID=A0AAW2YRJ1_9EUKA
MEDSTFDLEACNNDIRIKNQEYKEFDAIYDEKQNKRQEAEAKIDVKRREYQKLRDELTEIDNIKKQRLEFLRRYHEDSHAMHEWVTQNTHQFSKTIYFLPLEINIKEHLHAKYLELQCPDWLLRSFVCESVDDRQKLTQEARRQNRGSISVIVRQSSNSGIQRPVPIDQLKPFGITCYLDEAFQSPQIIKDVMNDNAKLHQVACGSNYTLGKEQELLNSKLVDSFFTPHNQYQTRQSKYKQSDVISRVTPLRDTKLFAASDSNRRSQIEQSIQAIQSEIKSIQEEQVNLYAKEAQQAMSNRETCRQKKTQLERQRTEHSRFGARLQVLERELAQENQIEDLTVATAQHKHKVQKLTQEKINLTILLKDEMVKVVSNLQEYNLAHLKRSQSKRYLMDAQREEREHKSAMAELKTKKEQLERQVDKIKDQMKVKKDEAQVARRSYVEKHPGVDIDQVLMSLPDDMQSIEDEIRDQRERAAAIYHDPHIMEQYEKRVEEIKVKRLELDTLTQQLETIDDDMKRLQEEWETPLRACVTRIGDTFSQYCKNIGISGEVALMEDEDYDKWQIQIRVKFRDKEELTTLSSVRQSGGERSVTTILYLLSLQTENKCPFRVVDEINQGMDPVNERKIFYQMLDSSRGDDIPQSFLITPKLLPDLVPNNANNITVLFIYNGPYNVTQPEWEKYAAKFMPEDDAAKKKRDESESSSSGEEESGSEEEDSD